MAIGIDTPNPGLDKAATCFNSRTTEIEQDRDYLFIPLRIGHRVD